jgi:hypothetical protein
MILPPMPKAPGRFEGKGYQPVTHVKYPPLGSPPPKRVIKEDVQFPIPLRQKRPRENFFLVKTLKKLWYGR